MKNAVKIVGNVCVFITLVFIIKLVLNMNFDYTIIFQTKNIMWVFILILLYSTIISFLCFPWKILVEYLSKKKLKLVSVYSIYSKSNLYKYIPGNIFQFVGRQVLAVEYRIEHNIVALSTIFDIGIQFLTGITVSFLFLGRYAIEQLYLYGIKPLEQYKIVGIILLILLFLFIFLLRKQICKIFDKYKKIIDLNLFKYLFQCFLLYSVFFLFYAITYLVLLVTIFDVSFNLNSIVLTIGASIFSWVIGFVVPGAPGGIGIREVVMIAVSGNVVDRDIIVVSIIIFRFVTLMSDIIIFVSSILIKSILERYKKN